MVSSSDGRNARRIANRQAVLDTALDLINQGVLDPSVEQLTQISGVSERSIFRYFDSLEDLREAAIAHAFVEVMPLLTVPESVGGTLDARIRGIVGQRLRLYEHIAGVARLARARELHFEMTSQRIARFRETMAAQIAVQFQPELAFLTRAESDRLRMALFVLLSFESWDMQTRGFGRSRAIVRSMWTQTLTTLLSAATFEQSSA